MKWLLRNAVVFVLLAFVMGCGSADVPADEFCSGHVLVDALSDGWQGWESNHMAAVGSGLTPEVKKKWTIAQGGPIDVLVGLRMGCENNWHGLEPTEPESDPVWLGYVCAPAPLEFSVLAIDPDRHVCEGPAMRHVFNIVAPSAPVAVFMTSQDWDHGLARELTSSQAGSRVAVRGWTNSVLLETPGDVLVRYLGTIADEPCPDHPSSVDTNVCLSPYQARLTVLQLEIETEEPGNLIRVGGTWTYAAKVTPETEGEYVWRVNNPDKLGFFDETLGFVNGVYTGQTAVVTGRVASASIGAEELTVEFTPSGHEDMVCAVSTNLTAYEIAAVKLTPVGAEEADLPTPVWIGAGGFDTAAHQAKVEIELQPSLSGIPVDIQLLEGRGHERSAKFTDAGETVTVWGGGEAATVETSADGSVKGVLRTSDSVDVCTLVAVSRAGGETEGRAEAVFNWITQFDPETDWTIEPEQALTEGIITNRLRLVHHRGPGEGAPWKPLDGHEIHFFVEEVWHYDDNGEVQVIFNTAENPSSDTDAWGKFLAPAVTDADGVATAHLDIRRADGLIYMGLVAYDWSVWQQPPSAPAMLDVNSIMMLSPATSTSGGERVARKYIARAKFTGPIRAAFAGYPTEASHVPVVDATMQDDAEAGGIMLLYLGNEALDNIVSSMRLQISQAGSWRNAADTEGRITTEIPKMQGGVLYAGPEQLDNFARLRISPYTNAQFRVLCGLPHLPNQTFEFPFRAVSARIGFDPDASPLTIDVPGAASQVHMFPKTVHAPQGHQPQALEIRARLEPTVLESLRFRSLDGSPFLTRALEKPFREVVLSANREGEGELRGKFVVNSQHVQNKVIVDAGGTQMMVAQFAIVPLDRIGRIEPSRFLCPDLNIAKPEGALPPEGELPANFDAGECQTLFVFDRANEPGRCPVFCETARMDDLAEASRALVWDHVEWVMPAVGSVDAPDPVAVQNKPWRTRFLYNGMPSHNNAFGNTNVTLRFKERHAWAYRQPVQFRFNRTGTKAAEAALAAKTVSADHAAANNPNWYVYWQQVAEGFEFGPQTKMSYSEDETAVNGGWAEYKFQVIGNKWEDEIILYDICKKSILGCVTMIHHENGHRQSFQLPKEQGGWGDGLDYDANKDADEDYVHDDWKQEGDPEADPPIPPGHGYTVGFRMGVNDRDRRDAWHHGWGPDDGPPWSPLVNQDGYDKKTGRGICAENERLVKAREDDIKKVDWSHK